MTYKTWRSLSKKKLEKPLMVVKCPRNTLLRKDTSLTRWGRTVYTGSKTTSCTTKRDVMLSIVFKTTILLLTSHEYDDVWWRTLTYTDVSWRILTYPDVWSQRGHWSRHTSMMTHPDVHWMYPDVWSQRKRWIHRKEEFAVPHRGSTPTSLNIYIYIIYYETTKRKLKTKYICGTSLLLCGCWCYES